MKAKNKKASKREISKIRTTISIYRSDLSDALLLMDSLFEEKVKEIEGIEKMFNYDLPKEAKYNRDVLIGDLKCYNTAINCLKYS